VEKPTVKTKVVSRKKDIKDIKLSSLLEITQSINANLHTDQLLQRFEHILLNHLNIGKVVLFGYDGRWHCLLRYGVSREYSQSIDIDRDLIHIKEISTITFEKKSLNESFEIVIPIYHKTQALAFLLIGDLEDKLEVSPAIKHLPFIQTLANIIVVAIENKKLYKETIRQAAIDKELELASEMQAMLFPAELPSDERLDISALYQPHQQVGGDYYDFFWVNENEVMLCMADVSGKGVAAALLMSNFQAYLRILVEHINSLTELAIELNEKVMMSAKGEKFITFFVARYNVVTRVMNYINAGHNPPLLKSGNNITLLKTGCTGLGMFEKLQKVKEGIVTLDPKSIVMCYTDGVVELENEKGEDFNIENLKIFLLNNAHLPMQKLNHKLRETLKEFKGPAPYIDDIALLSCMFS
jgi:phosphoserine phosphatase RsbU/P